MKSSLRVVRIDKVIDPDAIKEEREELAKVNSELILAQCQTEEEIIEAIKDADAVLTEFGQMTRRVIKSSPKLRVIVRYGIGYDTVDVGAATDNGVLVVNLPGYNVDEVADHTYALMLTCVRKVVYYNNLIKSGYWAKYSEITPMHSFTNQTLGLIGCGTIGRAVAKRAVGFNLKVLGTSPHLIASVAREYGITLVSMPELLKESDFVSVHASLSKETHHLVGEQEFRQMKPTAYFINASRGLLVDEAALTKALQERWIAGAGIDVFEQEPVDPNNPLLKMDNVVVTSHYAGWSDASSRRARILVGQEAARVITGKWPKNWVNKNVKPKFKLEKGD